MPLFGINGKVAVLDIDSGEFAAVDSVDRECLDRSLPALFKRVVI